MDRGASLISFVCLSHRQGTPIVTVHDGQWAYCRGGLVDAQQGHTWAVTLPTSVYELESNRVGLIRESLAQAI